MDNMYEILSAKVSEAEDQYCKNPIEDNYDAYINAINAFEKYTNTDRKIQLSRLLRVKESELYKAVDAYHLNSTMRNYDKLCNVTQSVAHILILQRAISGGVGSALAIQSLSEKHPLAVGVKGKFTRNKIKNMLLSTQNLSAEQIEGLLSRLSITSEGVEKLDVKSLHSAFEKGDITLKELNQGLAALRQEQDLEDEGADMEGKLGFAPQEFYDQLGK